MELFQVRTYGPSPCRAAVLHGGPGAIGSAAGLARGLAESCGVLEPLQSKYSVTEQVEELHRQLTAYASRPLVLIGHSWGAWLAALYAARHPGLAARLVLIGCGPLEAAYLPQLEARRLAHFTPEEAARYRELLAAPSAAGAELLQSLLQTLLFELLYSTDFINAENRPHSDNNRIHLFEQLNGYIFQHLSDPELSLEELAAKHYISPALLHLIFRQMAGCTPGKYIRDIRIKQAQKLLDQRETQIAEIAERTGFSSPAVFSRCFRREVGLSPSEYQSRQSV